MKILAFSGMHQDYDLLDYFLSAIERKDLSPDVFISAGDIGDEIHIDVFNKLSKLGKPIAFVGGRAQKLLRYLTCIIFQKNPL